MSSISKKYINHQYALNNHPGDKITSPSSLILPIIDNKNTPRNNTRESNQTAIHKSHGPRHLFLPPFVMSVRFVFARIYPTLSLTYRKHCTCSIANREKERGGGTVFQGICGLTLFCAHARARVRERATSSALARPRQQRVATVHLFALFLLIGNGRPRGALVFPRANRIRERASLSSLNVTLPLSLCLYTELAQVIIGLEPVQRHAIHKPFLSIYASTRERAGVLMSFSVPPISSSACDEFSRPTWTFCLRLLYYIILNF